MKLPGFLVPLVKSGVKSGVSKFVQYVEKYLDLLQSYHPFGTYYFFAGKDCDEPFITKNQTVIEELLGFIPPHKIVTSDGQELRVSHYSTKVQGIKHDSRFSLANVTEVTSPRNDDNDIEPGMEDKKSSKDKDEEKVNILDLLMEKNKDNHGEGALYDNTALYVAVESEDDKVRDIYKSRKLSEKGWIMLVSNHMVEQYIDIFKAKVQLNKSKYPMLASSKISDINHFAAPIPENKEDDTESKNDNISNEELAAVALGAASALKSAGKKWWNSAKDKYNKEKEEYIKKKELEKEKAKTQQSYPGIGSKAASTTNVVNPNLAQVQPAQAQYVQQPQYQYYVQPPQQLSGHPQQQPPPQQYAYYQPQTQYVQQQQPVVVNPNGGNQVQPQQAVYYVQQPQQIGNTQYHIAPQSSHYVVYQQPQQPQQPQNKSSYPSLSKR
eukprot:CAMPEP_0201595242 /NCGR_PEP_ID=MMETSP0190_2-20130828/192307_1 /ASSEMBLY_ACC=CAM_ASM_000263 /TAXON_ID=37353 /ORGANISM="Rosalina sp." /LENGTH=437 /DNA_ID=CAMNT_0048055155 /DNA_START=286 /DNA_END=1599 /DNA_ORIENTATION=-